MPVLKPKDKEMTVAVAAQNGASNSETPVEQPRQPGSLQGLLRFALEATRAEDAPDRPSDFQPLDPERRQFLETTLNGMIGNPVEELEKSIKILETMEGADNTDVEEVDTYLNTFEYITDFVGQIDLANAFHKIGGLAVFGPALHGENAEIKMAACDLLAELCQNNPYWQDVIVHTEIISILLDILQKNEHAALSNKTLYALSCITREHMDAYKRFVTYGGLNVLKDVFMRDADQQRARSARLLASLCRLDRDLPQRLCTLEYVNTLLETLDSQQTASRTPQPPRSSNEQVIELLTQIVTEYPQGMDECLQEQQNVVRQLHPRDILQRHLDRLVEHLDAGHANDDGLGFPREYSNGQRDVDGAVGGLAAQEPLANLMDRHRDNEEYINCSRLIYLIENIREVVDN